MDIERVLKIIKEGLAKDIEESRHFRDQCEDRELDPEEVKEVAKKSEILGILDQAEGLYKIWFMFKRHKDLNIIVKILPDGKLKFVTVFPCHAERRKK